MGGMLRGGAGALLLLSSASMARAQSAQCANLTWSAPGDGSDVEREFAVAFALPVQAVPGSVRMVGSPECVNLQLSINFISSDYAKAQALVAWACSGQVGSSDWQSRSGL